MTLTGRGWAALALAGAAIALALTFGQPGLNAVAAPLLGAVAYGVVALWRTDPPTAAVADVAPGYPGESRTVSIDLRGRGVLRVHHEWQTGLTGEPIDVIASPPATLEADVTLDSRGLYELGELTVWRRDSLGLVTSPVTVDLGTSVVVYPRIYRTADGSTLSPLLADDHHVERQAFESLREYRPGDPLRHIHWKSSAKQDGFLVTEFAPDRQTETLTIAADAAPGQTDEMATAVGTVALQALGAGLDVGLRLPDEHVPVGSGEAHRANLLGVLARVGHGSASPADHTEADVSIRATRQQTTIVAGNRRQSFDELLEGADTQPRQEVVPA